jgi:hypothetical protein
VSTTRNDRGWSLWRDRGYEHRPGHGVFGAARTVDNKYREGQRPHDHPTLASLRAAAYRPDRLGTASREANHRRFGNVYKKIRKLLPGVTVVGWGMGAGCFNYVPVVTGAAAPGTDVRIQLSAEGSGQLSRVLGARVNAVDGTLTTISPDSAMVVDAQWVQTADGLRERWTGAPHFSLPRSYVASVERRALDRRKSTFAAVAIAGAIAAVGVIAMRGGGSEGGRDPGGGTGVFRR